jgi:uncharacterized protein YndB with AHSA1/START domain
MPTKRTGETNISDAAVKEKTGKTWKQWFSLLDKWGAKEKAHKDIATHLRQKLGQTAWWSQMITVEYERKQRGRKVGERPAEGGFTLDVQRTVTATAKKAFETFLQPEHTAKWFTKKAKADVRVGGSYSNSDGDIGEFLAVEAPKRARFTWDNKRHCPGTIVELTVRAAGPGKVAVGISHSRLKNAKDREKMKQGWSWALDSLKSYLETGSPIPHEEWIKTNQE